MDQNTPRSDAEAVLRSAADDLPENQPGALAALAADFPELQIEAAVGRGGSGVVYRARQVKLGRRCALKVLDPALAARDPAFAERLQREGQALAQLDHPGILRVFDFGERAGRYYLLTEYVDGIDLRRLLALGDLQPAEALRLVPPICAALQYAHDHGVVHRDVKPENVLLDQDGNVKLADFGLARLVEPGGAAQLTRSSQVLGTPLYMAPEQWRGAAVDHRADIFALGVLLYELLTGQLPVGDFPPPSQRPGVPRRLDEVVRRAMATEPGRRYQQAAELGQAIAGGPGGAAPAAAEAMPPPPPRPTAERAPTPQPRPVPTSRIGHWFVFGLLLVVVGTVVVIVLNLQARASAELAAWNQEAASRLYSGRSLDGLLEHAPPSVGAGRLGAFTLVLGAGAAVLAMSFFGFRRIRRVRAGVAGVTGLGLAELMAWGPWVALFDIAVLAPVATMQGNWQAPLLALALLLVVPLNVVFFAWRYHRDAVVGGH